MSRDRKRSIFPWKLTGLCCLVAAALLYLRCDDGLGLLDRLGLREPTEEAIAVTDAAPPPPEQAAIERCRLRLDAVGLYLDGELVELADAVERCRPAGAADLVVTGDATFGTYEQVRDAMTEADVKIYQR